MSVFLYFMLIQTNHSSSPSFGHGVEWKAQWTGDRTSWILALAPLCDPKQVTSPLNVRAAISKVQAGRTRWFIRALPALMFCNSVTGSVVRRHPISECWVNMLGEHSSPFQPQVLIRWVNDQQWNDGCTEVIHPSGECGEQNQLERGIRKVWWGWRGNPHTQVKLLLFQPPGWLPSVLSSANGLSAREGRGWGRKVYGGRGRCRHGASVSGKGLSSAWLAGKLIPLQVLWVLTGF